jgi:hypothetical protein
VAAIGPLSIAVLRAVLPYSTVDDPTTVAEKVAAAPGAQSAVLWLAYLALLTLPLGILVVARVAVATRRVVGLVGGTLTWLGFLSLFLLTVTDQVPLAAAAVGTDPAAAGALVAAVGAHPTQTVALTVFLVGHVVGPVLLGVAVWPVKAQRAEPTVGAVPRWAAAALIVSQPLHVVFATVVPNPLLDALAWVLTTVGFVAVAATPPGRSSAV